MLEVAIVAHDTEQTVKTLKAGSQREAEKLERGMNINLDHRFYYTEIRTPSLPSTDGGPEA